MAKGARESTWDGVLLGETYQYLLIYPLPPKYNPYSDTSFSLLLGKTTIRTLATTRKLIWEEVQYLGKKQMPLLDNGKKKKISELKLDVATYLPQKGWHQVYRFFFQFTQITVREYWSQVTIIRIKGKEVGIGKTLKIFAFPNVKSNK